MADSKPMALGETLRAERKRRGWDIPRMAQELRAASDEPHKQPSLSSLQRNIERWETGQVAKLSERYRLLYATAFDIPDDELFPAVATSPGTPQSADHEDVERRRLLAALATLGVTASPALDAMQAIQATVDRSVGRNEPSHLSEWEEAIAEYGYLYFLQAPGRLFTDLIADLVTVQAVIKRNGTDRRKASWDRVNAGLAVLMAKTLCNLGQTREARHWWLTAQEAANSSGDLDLSLWISGEHLTHGLYTRRPAPILLRRVEEIFRNAPTMPSRGLAHLSTVRAQLLAMEGQRDSALTELTRTREIFERLPASLTGDVRTIANWGEDRLRYTEVWVYAHLGMQDDLAESALHVRAIHPADDVRVHAQVGLMQAFGLVQAGDVPEGIGHAQRVFDEVSPELRTTMVTSLAEQVLTAVPLADRKRVAVSEYRELLAADNQLRSIR